MDTAGLAAVRGRATARRCDTGPAGAGAGVRAGTGCPIAVSQARRIS